MKKILLFIAITLGWMMNLSAQKENLNNLFEKYQDKKGVTTIKIAKPMFSMLSKLNIQDADFEGLKPMLEKINGLKIMVVEKSEKEDSNKNLNINFNNIQSDINSTLQKLNYQELMTVNNQDAKVKFLSKDAVDGLLENLLLSVNSGDNVVLMLLDGKVSMEDVNRIANESQTSNLINTKSKKSVSKSSSISEEVRDVGQFHGISVSTGIKVEFKQGNTQSVSVKAEANLIQSLKTKVENGILKIYFEKSGNSRINPSELMVSITAPQLNSVSVSSAAEFYTKNTVTTDNFILSTTSAAETSLDLNVKNNLEISATSAAEVKVNAVAKALSVSSNSSADILLKGKVETAKFNISSASEVNAKELHSKNAIAIVSSAANLHINASESLDLKTSSGADVYYKDYSSLKKELNVTTGSSAKPY